MTRSTLLQRLPLLLLLSLSATGCFNLGMAQRADSIGKGNFVFGLEPGTSGSVTAASDSAGNQLIDPTNGKPTSVVGPLLATVDFHISGKYGVTDRFDLGARLGSSGGELLAKVQFTNPEDRSLVLSVAPQIGGFSLGAGGASVSIFNASIPLLIGLGVGEHQFVVGPRFEIMHIGASASGGGNSASVSGNILGPGLSAAFAFQLGEGFQLIPEVSLFMPVGATASASATGAGSTSGSGTFNGGIAGQFTVGFLFGKTRAGSPALSPSPIAPVTPSYPAGSAPPPPPPPAQ